MANQFVGNEDINAKALSAISDFDTKFKTQRTEYEDIWRVADYMVKAAQNRTLASEEITKGVNPQWVTTDLEQAETGSTMAFRQWRQLASQLSAVALSRDVPWKYVPVTNEGIWESASDGDDRANQLNALAKWTLKMDGFNRKMIEFAHDIKKYGNSAIMTYMHRVSRKQIRQEPTFTEVAPVEPGGEPQYVHTGYKDVEYDAVVENWPSWMLVALDSIYADVLIPTFQGQDCVIVESLVTKSMLLDAVEAGEYDQSVFETIGRSEVWDGNTGGIQKRERMENQGQTLAQPATDQYLRRDVYLRCPIVGAAWTPEAPVADIYWITTIGNAIRNSKVVRFERNPHPNDKIPLFVIHDIPDDPGRLYHMAPAQILRSNYSVECTIKNQMIDHNSQINHPPLKEIEGQVRGTDRRYGPHTRFVVDTQDSISEFQIRDLSQSNMLLLDWIKNDSREALSTTANVLGEAYGGRTSALEAGNAYRNSMQPHMITIRYVLEQFLGVLAEELKAYWEAYAIPGQVVAISDDTQKFAVQPKDIHGEFDVEIDLVDEYEDDVVQSQRIYEVIQLVGSSPEIAKYFDIPALMKEWMMRSRLRYNRILQLPISSDAETVATNENQLMMQGGRPVQPKPNEDAKSHLRVHKAYRVQYKGVEDQFPNIVILDQHIAATEQTVRSAPASTGSPPAPSGNQGAGEMGGNEIAGALGAAVPQGP